MTAGSAERELELALAEQARCTTRYERSIGTSAELSAYGRLRAANRWVGACDRRVREQRSGLERIAFSLPADATAPGRARSEVSGWIRGQVGLSVLRTVELLVSETVTNAVTHGTASADATVEVEAAVQADLIRIEVTCCGPPFDYEPERPPVADPRGRGLFLVDQMARTWGSEHAATTTRVWFEVAA